MMDFVEIFWTWYYWCAVVMPLMQNDPLEQNGSHFADNIFKCILLRENNCILYYISLNLFLLVHDNIKEFWYYASKLLSSN